MNQLLDWLQTLPTPLAEWLATLAAAALALVGSAVVYRIGRRLLQRAARDHVQASAVLQGTQLPARWLLPLIALNLVWHAAPDELLGVMGLRRLTALGMVACATWLIMRGINHCSAAYLARLPLQQADNFEARRLYTQTRVLSRTLVGSVGLVGTALALMTFPTVRQVGASLLASAGVVGIVAGFAARPVLGNLIAGLQIGLTQPIRLDDVVIVEGEWGVIEEINSAYVVVRIWDQRRLIVPLQWWIEHPFQNWTRHNAELIGTVFLWVDYRMPLAPLRDALQRACAASPLWDGRLALLQVTEAGEQALQLRALVTAASSSAAWDLRCAVREALVDFIQRDCPQYLPVQRAQWHGDAGMKKTPADPSAGAFGDGARGP